MRPVLNALASVLVASTSLAQTPVLVITGRVVAGGAAIVGADIVGGDVESIPTKFAKTDANGVFRLVFVRGAVTIGITARAGGFVSQTKRVTATATDTLVLVPEFRLVAASVQTLKGMTVVASAPARDPPRRSIGSTPGDTFTAMANGDLNGNGTLSTLSVVGALNANNILNTAPYMREYNVTE